MNSNSIRIANIKSELKMEPHPEGGYFVCDYISNEFVQVKEKTFVTIDPHQPELQRVHGKRSAMSSIYYLLDNNQYSAWHIIDADEIWHYHEGKGLMLHIIDPQGQYRCENLGPLNNISKPQIVVPAGHYFAAELIEPSDYCLVSCIVAPAFDYNGFRMVDKFTLKFLTNKIKDLKLQKKLLDLAI